jgi:asparagine synthase (glutamine-hydrolysing)
VSALAGVLGHGPLASERVEAMCHALAHRGRDGSGVYSDDHIALGMSAGEPSSRRVPAQGREGRYRVAWDGHLTNAALLAQSHAEPGAAGDGALVIAAYAARGLEALSALRGAFAFALWDRAERTLVLARDRLGVKPLCYRREGRALAFASEAKALWAGGGLRPELNPSALCDLLGHLHLSGDDTCFEGVAHVPAGHALVITPSGERLVRYWEPIPRPREPMAPEELGEAFAALLRVAVERRLSSEPTALALSGGIDSGGLAAIVKRLGGRLRTFALGFDAGDAQPGAINELPRARFLARELGCEHHEVVVSGEDIAAVLPAVVARYDQPFAGSLAPYLLAQRLPDDVRVLLSGLGADEILGGYGRAVGMERHVGEVLTPVRLAPAVRSYYILDALASSPERMALLHPDLRKVVVEERSAPKVHEQVLRERFGAPMADVCLLLDLKTRLANEYLFGTDVAFSSRAIDVALPFLDEDVVDFVLGLPLEQRDHASPPKLALRLALAPLLPEGYMNLPKAGFALPLAAWLRGPLLPWVRDLLSPEALARRGYLDVGYVAHVVSEHEAGQKPRPYLVWTLCMIEAWARHHLDGEGLRAPARVEPPHVTSAVATRPVSSALGEAPCRDLASCHERERKLHAPLRGEYLGTAAARPSRIAAVLDLRALGHADYVAALRRQHRGSALRHARKADRAGYRCRRFSRELHLPDIVAINQSKEVRSGGAMRGAYVLSVDELGGAPAAPLVLEPAPCPAHHDAWWGIFEAAPGHRQGAVEVDERLVGYILLRRHGSAAFYSQLMGHGAKLDDGIMYRLHLAVMEWLCSQSDAETQGIDCLIYAGHYQGAPGLRQWKQKTLFRPAHLIEPSLIEPSLTELDGA